MSYFMFSWRFYLSVKTSDNWSIGEWCHFSHHFKGKHEQHAGSNFRLCCLTRLYQILICALETCARFYYYCVEC